MKHLLPAVQRTAPRIPWAAVGGCAAALLLTAAAPGGQYAPWALAAVAAAGVGWQGLLAVVCAGLGALLFMDFQPGLRHTAAALLIFCANTALCNTRLYRRPRFRPIAAVCAAGLTQLPYLIQRGGRQWALCMASLALLYGAAALLPLAVSEWGPARSSAISRIETEKVDALYSALTADPELKAKTGYCGVNVWFNHGADGSYTLQSGDDCVLNATLTGPYADAESFAADCVGIMQLAADKDLGFTSYHFSSGEDTDDGISYYLDCVASYPAGLTAAQVAQRVTESYHYDGSSFSSEADRDEYIKTRLRDDIAEEYANAHDDVYPDDDYVDAEVERRFNEQFGIATPESAAE